ncbi:MAG: hypothetical protein R2824_24125 [Saprospiraceae bacterium]
MIKNIREFCKLKDHYSEELGKFIDEEVMPIREKQYSQKEAIDDPETQWVDDLVESRERFIQWYDKKFNQGATPD